MIIQGSNNPIVIQFDANISEMPTLIITLWSDKDIYQPRMIKRWNKSDINMEENIAVCPITEAETKALPPGKLVLEAKGLDDNGNTIFWDQYEVDVKGRRDRNIVLTQTT